MPHNPDAAPTYEQIRRLGQWADEIILRISNELASVQQAGPTRISGMRQELDRAAQAAVREWAKELKGADYEIRHDPAGQG